QAEQLVRPDRCTAKGTDSLQPFEARAAQVELGATGVGEVGTREVAARELHPVEPGASEVVPAAARVLDARLLELRVAEVRVVEPAVARRHHLPRRAAELDAGRAAVDEAHPVER